MNMANTASVRAIQIKDIDLIADYWLKSDPEFLISLGVDLDKRPTRKKLVEMLSNQIDTDVRCKQSYAVIWELDGKPIGHSNVNEITFGAEAKMHLHLWQSDNRRKGLGTELVKKSLPYYFHNLQLQKLICEPYARNAAPNRTLEKVGFTFVKRYTTVPGSLNFEQEVCRWELSQQAYMDKYEFKT